MSKDFSGMLDALGDGLLVVRQPATDPSGRSERETEVWIDIPREDEVDPLGDCPHEANPIEVDPIHEDFIDHSDGLRRVQSGNLTVFASNGSPGGGDPEFLPSNYYTPG